jgi:hypothetical protein
MIANFFQSLDRHGVEYLLISGQATVLYGAATFSEDIDLWIRPTKQNRDNFIAALCDCEACYYKLTPLLTVENLQAGHGFHFLLPTGKNSEMYLDVMGNPPRAGSFDDALATARRMETEWGMVRTIGLKPLVELKKTQRLGDYPIIGKLALAWFQQPECGHGLGDFLWAAQNIFTLPELADFFAEQPPAIDVVSHQFNAEIGEFGRQMLAGGEADESLEHHVSDLLQSRISGLQLADRHHWRAILRQLKELRGSEQLMTEGKKVSKSD